MRASSAGRDRTLKGRACAGVRLICVEGDAAQCRALKHSVTMLHMRWRHVRRSYLHPSDNESERAVATFSLHKGPGALLPTESWRKAGRQYPGDTRKSNVNESFSSVDAPKGKATHSDTVVGRAGCDGHVSQ